MSRKTFPEDLSGLTDRQHGLVRRDQVIGKVLTTSALRWRLQRRQWLAVLPAVYATRAEGLTYEQRACASLLYAGDGAQLTGPAALRLHGLHAVPPGDTVHVLIPRHRRVRSAGFVVVSRTGRMCPLARSIDHLTVAGPARAVADTARLNLDSSQTRALVTEAVRRGVASIEEIDRELREGPRQGSLPLRQALRAISEIPRSAAEEGLREICGRSRVLPPIQWHPSLHGPQGPLPSPLAWIPDVAIAIQVDSGGDGHVSPDRWEDTAELGVQTLLFTPDQIHGDPGAVRAAVECAYLDRARRGVPAVVQARP